MNKESAAEKINSILEKMEVDEAIEVYHKCGEKLHQRIEAKQKEASEQLKKLRKESEA